MARHASVVFLASLVHGAYDCPSSAALLYASCRVEATTPASCASVRSEVSQHRASDVVVPHFPLSRVCSPQMLARVVSQPANWRDPHNGGTYTVLDASDPITLSLQRLTGDGKYTDKLTFRLEAAAPGGCTLFGCSASQVTSVADFSTNYCNLRMLYCGVEDGCEPVSRNAAFVEVNVSPSFGAGHDPLACLVGGQVTPSTEPQVASAAPQAAAPAAPTRPLDRTSALDVSLVGSVFVIACRSIGKALLVVAAGMLLTRRGALTPAVRKGLSVMSAGLLVPCLLLERFARTVTPALLSEAGPILPVGFLYVALGVALGAVVASPCWTPREIRAPTIAATAFANSQARRSMPDLTDLRLIGCDYLRANESSLMQLRTRSVTGVTDHSHRGDWPGALWCRWR